MQFSNQKEMSLFLTSLTKAAIGIFSSFSSSPVTATGARILESPIPKADIYGTIYLTGSTAGRVEIALNKQIAKQLAANIAMCDPEQLSDNDIYDGVGEIINQIAGTTRTLLWDQGYKTEISLPVVTGKKGLNKSKKKDDETIYIIDFDCTTGYIALQICFHLIDSKRVPQSKTEALAYK